MDREPSQEFRQAFDAAFSFPKVQSARAKELRLDLEIISDTLAGPMFHVLTGGQYDYVFRDKEGRFPGVVDEPSFRAWATGVARSYGTGAASFKPETPAEAHDRDVLLEKARSMLKVIDAAEAEIRRARARDAVGGASLERGFDTLPASLDQAPRYLEFPSPLPCPHCGRGSHRYRHLFDGPLVCEACGRSFRLGDL